MGNFSTIELADGVSRRAVMDFMDNCKKNGVNVHSFKIIRDGKTQVRIAPKPYSFDYKQQLFSLSKSFTSTAVGFLYDEGIIDLNDKFVDIFPEKCPENLGENVKKMTVRHILSMNTGHEGCVILNIKESDDPVCEFMKIEPEYAPGTHFAYNNAATYMLSEIVSRYTGVTVYDYLSQKLFKPLGIENTYWNVYKDGKSQGAVGFHASCDDIAKLGQLYLDKGVFDGKRILSEEWVELATKSWSDNSGNGTPDWTAGYGFQFWNNSREGYRADGAAGQLSVVIPSQNAVFAAQVYSENMQKEIDLAFELVYNLYGDDDVTDSDLKMFVDSYNGNLAYNNGVTVQNGVYKCEKNKSGITFIEFADKGDSVDLRFSDGRAWHTMSFGKSEYIDNNIKIKGFKPTIWLCENNDVENTHFVGRADDTDVNLRLRANYLDNPFVSEYVCAFDGDNVCITSNYGWEIKAVKVD